MPTDTLSRRSPAAAVLTPGRPKVIIWHPSRRPAETNVRDALESLSTFPSMGRAEGSKPTPQRIFGPGLPARSAALLLVAAVVVASVRAILPGCEPISYTMEGSPPDHVHAEFRLAIREIHQRSGLLFEEGPRGASKLRIKWSDALGTAVTSPATISDADPAELLGLGTGRWRQVFGGRTLFHGDIEVDATADWPLGLDRGDTLAAIFVHELGHVIGLPHSAEASSFMHEVATSERPRWTADDLERLAKAGRDSGCRPGSP